MQNNIVKLVIIGAIIGLFIGVIGNLFGSGALDYTATYTFPGADDFGCTTPGAER